MTTWEKGELTIDKIALLKENKQLNHALIQIYNFDVIKLPDLEVCFYTPRSGGVTSVLHANR